MNLPKHLTVFFGDEGLSQTEANHQANMVKEIADGYKRVFANTAAFTEILEYNSTKEVPLDSKKGIKDLRMEAVREGNLYALSAWLREAVKAKQNLIDLVRNAPDIDFLQEGESFPRITLDEPRLINPANPKNWKDEDIIGEFTIAERAEFLMLEAQAAHLGKKLHADGILNKINHELATFDTYRFHNLADGAGLKAFPVKRVALYAKDDFQKDFFQLQDEHRGFEAKLNWYKARIQNEVTMRNAQAQEEYRKAFQDVYSEYNVKRMEFERHVQDVNKAEKMLLNEIGQRRLELVKQISAYKIVVPNELKETLAFVQGFQKK